MSVDEKLVLSLPAYELAQNGSFGLNGRDLILQRDVDHIMVISTDSWQVLTHPDNGGDFQHRAAFSLPKNGFVSLNQTELEIRSHTHHRTVTIAKHSALAVTTAHVLVLSPPHAVGLPAPLRHDPSPLRGLLAIGNTMRREETRQITCELLILGAASDERRSITLPLPGPPVALPLLAAMETTEGILIFCGRRGADCIIRARIEQAKLVDVVSLPLPRPLVAVTAGREAWALCGRRESIGIGSRGLLDAVVCSLPLPDSKPPAPTHGMLVVLQTAQTQLGQLIAAGAPQQQVIAQQQIVKQILQMMMGNVMF